MVTGNRTGDTRMVWRDRKKKKKNISKLMQPWWFFLEEKGHKKHGHFLQLLAETGERRYGMKKCNFKGFWGGDLTPRR